MSEKSEILLFDDEYLDALLEAIAQAKSSIDIQVYMYEEDAVGKKVADALCKAAQRGVKIRLLIDGVGSIDWGGELAEQMKNAGIEVKVYHPLPWRFSHWYESRIKWRAFFSKILTLLEKMNSRNHAKVSIIDKQIVMVGSANVSAHLIDHDGEKKWRETTVRLTGTNIEIIQYAFDRAMGEVSFRQRLHYPFRKIITDDCFYLNFSWRLRHYFMLLLLRKMKSCREKIWLANAYFIPNLYLLRQLIRASRRGVDVRIMLPAKSDVPIVSIASTTFYERLLKHGIKVYEYLPTMLHEKVMILDDDYYIGSSNLDDRSIEHDLEANVKLQTNQAKSGMHDQFNKDLEQSRQIQSEDIRKQSIFTKLIAYIILWWRYYL